MTYESEIHRRQSIRLPGYDYSRPGAYFVTICTKDRECLFGKVVNAKMILNELGQIVKSEWLKSSEIRSEIVLDTFQVMPNHFHAIAFITDFDDGDVPDVGATGRSPLQDDSADPGHPRGPRPKSLSSLMAGFQSTVTARINRVRGTSGAKLWQRNYYDRIVRGEDELNRSREYIIHNPLKWELDKNNPDNWKLVREMHRSKFQCRKTNNLTTN